MTFDEMEVSPRERLDALGPVPRAELLHVLMLPDFERAERIGEPSAWRIEGPCRVSGRVERESRPRRRHPSEASLAPTSYNHLRRPCESGRQASQTAIPPSTPGKGSDSASAATASRSTRVSRRQGRTVTVP
jgi:hypothetical protein